MIRVGLSLQYPALEAGVRALLSADAEIAIVTDDTEAADVHIVTPAASTRGSELMSIEAGAQPVLVLGAEGQDLRRLWHLTTPWGVLPMDVESEELCAAVRALAAGSDPHRLLKKWFFFNSQ